MSATADGDKAGLKRPGFLEPVHFDGVLFDNLVRDEESRDVFTLIALEL